MVRLKRRRATSKGSFSLTRIVGIRHLVVMTRKCMKILSCVWFRGKMQPSRSANFLMFGQEIQRFEAIFSSFYFVRRAEPQLQLPEQLLR